MSLARGANSKYAQFGKKTWKEKMPLAAVTFFATTNGKYVPSFRGEICD